MKSDLLEKSIKIGDRRSSLWIYKFLTTFTRISLKPWITYTVENQQILDLKGPTVLAPVHRSHLDPIVIANHSKRRLRALGKESLFKIPLLGYIFAALGAIPVKRGEADRASLISAIKLISSGDSMIIFPEGTRQKGLNISECLDGPAWIAAKTNARIVPIAIVGSDLALPPGAKFIHRAHIKMVVGEPLEYEENGKRISRNEIAEMTSKLKETLQGLMYRARNLN